MSTTPDELDGFYVVRAILREVVSVKRVVMRDVQSYCGILLDDNNRKPICRLHFNASQKHVTFFQETKKKCVCRLQIDDLYKHADRLKATVAQYESKKAPQKGAGIDRPNPPTVLVGSNTLIDERDRGSCATHHSAVEQRSAQEGDARPGGGLLYALGAGELRPYA